MITRIATPPRQITSLPLSSLSPPFNQAVFCLSTGDHDAPQMLLGHLPAGVSGYTYGLNLNCNFLAQDVRVENGTFSFQFVQKTEGKITELAKYMHLSVAGQHNVQNAAAALAVASILGLDVERAAAQLANFAGSGRRFELAGEINGITLIDDYAHHPTEISATLAAARSRYPRSTNLGCLAAAHIFSHPPAQA